jgi:hypothetical protein
LPRSDSRFTVSADILKTRISGPLLKVAAETGTARGSLEGYRERAMQAAVAPVDLRGTRWFVLAVQETAETLAPVAHLRNTTLAAAAILMLIAAGIGIAFARSITRSISTLDRRGDGRAGRRDCGITASARPAADGSGQLAQGVTVVTAAIGETSQAAAMVLGASRDLTVEVETLRGEVNAFLRNVAAA